jgi:outer membrane protein OmpA-like peptidoglycan-associated protein
MRNHLLQLVAIFTFTFQFAYGQVTYNGLWKGAVFTTEIDDSSENVVFISISKYKSNLEAFIRIEKKGAVSFYTFKAQGEFLDSILTFNKSQLDKKSKDCILAEVWGMKLKYIDSTGYLEGELISTNKSINSKRIVLFKSTGKIDAAEKKETSHAWLYLFQKEYKLGLVAPDLRDEVRKNFQFQSVYFDPSESILKEEFKNYLKKVIQVVNGHTDLRLKVIGHTDWDGSDSYNEKLSLKRAETIIHYLESNGLNRDRIEYEFKGEKKPAESNETLEGKKRNRRVDFQFI